ncbi:MAG: MFS transporter [Firmicutes bacterium]|nr:MFS transporter [Bacillota bacterium]
MARALTVYLFGVFVGALDMSVIGPAFPLIARDFGISLTWDAWTVTAYTVAYATATVLAGALGDRYGRRLLFALGMLLFGAGSAVAAASGTFAAFLLGRAVQGAGAGTIFPNAQAEGVRFFPEGRRGLALGIFGAVFGLASIIGPNVGGALAQAFGWPAIFLVNIPLAAVVLLLVPTLPATPGHGRELPDVVGGLAFAGTVAGLLLGLTFGGAARSRWTAWAAAALFAALFAYRQRRARTPFLDTGAITGTAGATLVAGAAIVGLDMAAAVFVPGLAQRALHFSVFGSGLAVMPAAVSGAVLAGVGGVLVDRIGPRRVLQIGLAAGAVGGVLLALPHLTVARFMVAMAFFGMGTAFTMGAPLNRIALALYRDERAGEALSLVAVFRTIGLAAGPVLLAVAARHAGDAGLFGTVTLASLAGILLFSRVRDVRAAAGEAAS